MKIVTFSQEDCMVLKMPAVCVLVELMKTESAMFFKDT